MNIDGKNLISLIKTYTDNQVDKKGKGKDGAPADGTGKGDEVRLSEFSKDVQKVQEGLQKVEDVRQEKVKELKAKIEAGTYNVSGKDIAEKMIKRIIDLSA